ncbi:hypothetical protein V3C99_007196 [Haemonchus contortus]
MLVFNVVAVIIQAIIILDVIVSHASSGDYTVYPIRILSNCFQLVSWYFSSALVFLIGLNRIAMLTKGLLSSAFTERERLLWISLILLTSSTIAGALPSGAMSNLLKLYDVKIGSEFIFKYGHLFSAMDCFFAALPLCSCSFYIAAFKKLRSIRRSGAPSVTTDRAENSVLKQGFLICILFTIPQLSFLFSRYVFDFNAEFYLLSQAIFYISTNLPPIGFPVIVLLCSKEMRKLLRFGCFKQHHRVQPMNPEPFIAI